MRLLGTAAITLLPLVAPAQVTVPALVGHLTGSAPLPSGQFAGADLNQDGALDSADVTKTLQAVVDFERALMAQTFGAPYDLAQLGSDSIEFMIFCIFRASELNNATTISGTLTALDASNQNFSYNNMPTDKLIFVTSTGAQVIMTFAKLLANTDSEESFIYQHDIDFTITRPAIYDLRIVGQRDYASKEGDKAWTSLWSRTITGPHVYQGESAEINLTHTGREIGSIEPPFAEYNRNHTYSGSISSPFGQTTIEQSSTFHLISNNSQNVVVRNFSIACKNTASAGAASYRFNNVAVRWETYSLLSDPGQFNVVGDPPYWQASGTVLKNNEPWGTAQFTGPVIQGTKGPDFVVTAPGVESGYLLHTLIPDL